MVKYFKTKDEKKWFNYTPTNKNGLIEITEAEWNAHLEDIKTTQITNAMKKAHQIASLKHKLAKYDYIGVKIAMGVATKEEYATEIAKTEEIRQQIRELEK